MYVVQGLPALGVETVTIQSIEEGYRYSGEGDRAVLHPHVGPHHRPGDLPAGLRQRSADPDGIGAGPSHHL